MGRRAAVATLAAAAMMLPLLTPTPAEADTSTPPPPTLGLRDKPSRQFSQDTDTIIVTFDRNQDDPEQAATEAVQQAADQVAGVDIVAVTPITDKTVAVTLDQTVTASEAAEIGGQAEDIDGVRAAEPSATLTTGATNDTYYDYLWNVIEPSDGITFGTRAEAAWTLSTGTGVIVGVIDTGITSHPDLNGNVVAGYDFVSDITQAGDGNGRDNNPADPGDYCAANGDDSSWHGTHVAGIVAAIRNNSAGVVGVAPGARIEALRALGRCGGSEADIIAAIRWGAGLTVTGLPTNPNPVGVLNLSIGGDAVCSTAMQDAINAAVTKGVPVVVAAGNENQPLSNSVPANCDNVIRVTASTYEGTRAAYSNYGTTTHPATIAAPGGSGLSDANATDWIISAWNTGTSAVGSASYAGMVGTSMAAPHVSAVAALLKAKDPNLTVAQIEMLLVGTATPMVDCSTPACGPGVVSAPGALNALVNSPAKDFVIGTSGSHLLGDTLTVYISGSPGVAFDVQWVRDGAPVVGETTNSYTLTAADVGTKVGVKVTASYLGQTASKSSTPLMVYESLDASVPTPVISGDPMPGGRLTFNFTASTLGADTIRWMRDGVQVGWDPTFTLTAADVGHQYTVTHIVTHAGDLVEKTSQPVTIVPNTVTNLATPVVTGTAMVGGRLTTAGTGATGATYSYQWLRNATAITGATAASYTLTSSDLAAQLTVRLTASRFGQSMSKTSAPVTVAPNLVTSLRSPVISGSAKVGKTLTAAPTGATGANFTYQWYRSGTAITGATGPTRTLTASDYGKVMTVTVTATYLGQKALKTSAATAKVALGAFTNSVRPYTSGTYRRGYTLKAHAGTWSPTPSTVRYRWLRNGTAITGATSSSYRLRSSDRGKRISVRVKAYRTGYVTRATYSLSHRIA